MPDLEALDRRFGQKGLVILAISDEEAGKVQPGRKVNELFCVEGIPKSFVYDREGKIVAQAIGMRTQRQFLEMLAHAGLE
jgi:thioredoxin-related protein